MNKQKWIDYSLTFSDSYLDYPFDEEWALIRHASNQKTFAFIYCREGRLFLNLKCLPMDGDFLKSAVPGITPAYHMNKRHWITVEDGIVPEDEIKRLLGESFALTAPKRKIKERM